MSSEQQLIWAGWHAAYRLQQMGYYIKAAAARAYADAAEELMLWGDTKEAGEHALDGVLLDELASGSDEGVGQAWLRVFAMMGDNTC